MFGKVQVRCPDCGDVEVSPDVYDYHPEGPLGTSVPVSGCCPKCGDRLFFAAPDAAPPTSPGSG